MRDDRTVYIVAVDDEPPACGNQQLPLHFREKHHARAAGRIQHGTGDGEAGANQMRTQRGDAGLRIEMTGRTPQGAYQAIHASRTDIDYRACARYHGRRSECSRAFAANRLAGGQRGSARSASASASATASVQHLLAFSRCPAWRSLSTGRLFLRLAFLAVSLIVGNIFLGFPRLAQFPSQCHEGLPPPFSQIRIG